MLKARRGLRQGDPLSPFLFVLVMEYFHRKMNTLKQNPDFNFHPKCERVSIIDVSFADDVMLFTRGDETSVQLLMSQFEEFSAATGLQVNKSKCKIYFGGVKAEDQCNILMCTGFDMGRLPFKYLGVPLDGKKLSVAAYAGLIDRITARMSHWSSKLLSYAGRTQLIRSVITSMTTYWMQLYPIPKKVIKQIESLCRSFLWSNTVVISRKAPVGWDKVCDPKNAGGLRITDLRIWNIVLCAKLLWNLSIKADRLWIRWLNAYYMKGQSFDSLQMNKSQSWVVRNMLKCREIVVQTETWRNLQPGDNLNTSMLYKELRLCKEDVPWKRLMFDNVARPRAIFILWLACHDRLYTKDRLRRMGMNVDEDCFLCEGKESRNHLFFACPETRNGWIMILDWLKVSHSPGEWNSEVDWMIKKSGMRNAVGKVLKAAFTEAVYQAWRLRNLRKNGETVHVEESWILVKHIIAARCGNFPKLNRVICAADNRC